MRKFIASLVAAALLATTAVPAFAEDTQGLKIYLENHLLDMKEPVKLIQNRTMIGFRDYFEATDVSVHWFNDSREAHVELPDKTIVIRPDTGELLVNGTGRTIDVPPQIINGRIYLPLRALAETMGYGVRYQAQKNGPNLVFLTYEEPAPGEDGKNPTQPPGDRVTVSLPKAVDGEQVLGYTRTKTALVQVVALPDRVLARTIPFDGSAVTVMEKELPAGTKATALKQKADGVAWVLLQPLKGEEPKVNGRFVGVGLPNTFDSYTSVKTSKGTFPLYTSEEDSQVLALSADGFELKTVQREGYAFDVQSAVGTTYEDIQAEVTDDGTYVLRIHKQLVLIKPTESEARRVPYDQAMSGNQMTVVGNRIYTWGVVNKKLFAGIIDSNGEVLRPYTEIARADREVQELRLMESRAFGRTFAFVLNDYTRNYLVTWDADKGTSTLKVFPKGVPIHDLLSDENGQIQSLSLASEEATLFLQ